MRYVDSSAGSRRLTLGYLFGASIWLLGTTGLLLWFTPNFFVFGQWRLISDLLFITVSTALLVVVLRRLDLQRVDPRSLHAQPLFAESHAVMLLIDPQSGEIVNVNRAAERFYGYSRERLCTMLITDLNTLSPDEVRQEMGFARTSERTFFRFRHRLSNGSIRDVEVYSAPITLGGRLLLHSIVHDVTERTGIEAHLSAVVRSVMDAIVSVDADQQIILFNPAAEQLFGCTAEDAIGQPLGRFLPVDHRAGHVRQVQRFMDSGMTARRMGRLMTVAALRADGVSFPAEVSIATVVAAGRRIATAILRDVSEQVQHEREREALLSLSIALRNAAHRAEMAPVLLDQVVDLVHAEGAALLLYDPIVDMVDLALGRGYWSDVSEVRLAAGTGITGEAMLSGRPLFLDNVSTAATLTRPDLFPAAAAAACLPLTTKAQSIGVLWVVRAAAFSEHERGLLLTITDMAATAIDRAALHEETQRRLRRLAALRAIDLAMLSSSELAPTLDRILIEVLAQLEVDAGLVLLHDPADSLLHLVAQHGLHAQGAQQLQVRIGEGLAGQAALTRRRLAYHEQGPAITPQLAGMVAEEGFVQGYAVPLLFEDGIIGVLDVFLRTPRSLDSEWFDFLDALAGQAAIAIQRAMLVTQLQHANQELAVAYDETLAGWARALELRDEETEGHSRRVTALTVRLAEVLGLPEDAIVHLRRGALLHDIGKMGVPDAILHKPGPLTPEERREMERHPVYAQMWLSPIKYLQPALDIPLYHHERWDGNGYPQGLRGTQIPQAARIFAVVDVWDALTSDRPYRPAWSPERARSYLEEQAGTQFDPEIVAAFLQLLR